MVLEAKVADSILAAVDQDRLLTMEQECVRIPSFSYAEQACADYLGRVMGEIGLEVEMMEVEDPMGTGRRSRQPVGRLCGTGDGPSLMLNGHMDHRELVGDWDRDPFSGHFEDGKIYGRGAQDDKGGIVALIVQRMGPSLRPIPEGGWLTFERHPDLPTFPQLHYDEIVGDHMSRVTSGEMTMMVQVRTVPGQSARTIKADVERLLATMAKEHPNFDVTVEAPPQDGRWAGMDSPAFSTPAESKLVATLARNHDIVTGSPSVTGAEPRLGAAGDGNLLAAAGVEIVLYGPGTSAIFDTWPTANEYVSLEELTRISQIDHNFADLQRRF